MTLRNITFLLLAVAFLAGCELEETNINPNDPTDVPVTVLLPTAMEETAENLSEEAAVIAGIFSQYFTGVDNRALTVESYLLDEAFNMNPLWQDFYNGPLNILNIIIDKSEADGSAHYAGVAKVLMALNLGTAASLWGDIPYTQAFQGGANFSPSYDPQETIYMKVQALLDEAIQDLQAESTVSPGDDDVIYQGDLDRWAKAAHALKARYYMHTIKRDAAAPAKALDAIANAFQSPSESLVYTFGFTEAEQNPWFIYFKNTPYVEIDPFFSDLLSELEDPRESRLIRRSFGLERVGDFYAAEDASVPIITYAELKMLEAEARLITGEGGAEAALQEGVRTHIEEVTGGIPGEEMDAYLDAHATLSGDTEDNLRTVLQQLYIAHFTQVEGWTDYRRTGFPELSPNPNGENPQNPGGDIPRRFIYPQNERLFNNSFPAENPNLQGRFWWDAE
ncbi:SusD/RagB family nutrient-binding outer membrane lipoprotein [Phaeodactylibacter sp.]|uniref:SusD/RagB family nutrient-binding outer membrane lipoprotein n=1 Tax=Phaeodactylibacter sp. TaxID=1940289 RepID=UPI0025DF4E8E|nr:SusD/RagB family nutrient-binding outer membrane lipoprotein [Phaeodactylibacter sp.]MCI4650304.1 SusD/RagB family nutrient-binding outer membrane lipoprotein [Phaeodactylibacter sp.]MCI5091132.1 SusD/RagB family nutrient-binding outer membrane lipoprotein [Phaeodactylibacter sp.]